jgi:hypothetical protein
MYFLAIEIAATPTLLTGHLQVPAVFARAAVVVVPPR